MIPWDGVCCCCLGAAATYLFGWWLERNADALKSVPRVNNLRDLPALLDTASKVLPLVVTISGRVGSETPIKYEHSSLRGVIVEEMAEQHYLKRNDAGPWKKNSSFMFSMKKEVPWYLDDGTGHVYVVGARGAIDATGSALNVASSTFEDSKRPIVRETQGHPEGLKLQMLGVHRIESVLPVGTPLTVVGEVVKDDLGTVWIQRPHKGPFYVSRESIDYLIAYLVTYARLLKVASGGITIFGVYLLVKHVIQNILERRNQKRLLDAAAKREEQESDGLPFDIYRDRIPDKCVICLENNYNAVFVQCGHMCCCIPCASRFTSCPVCHQRIDEVVKAFRS